MLAPTNTLADHAGERDILARLAHNIGTDIPSFRLGRLNK